MLRAAIDFWLLPTTLFFEMLSPASKPLPGNIPVISTAQRVRRKRKVIRSRRGN